MGLIKKIKSAFDPFVGLAEFLVETKKQIILRYKYEYE